MVIKRMDRTLQLFVLRGPRLAVDESEDNEPIPTLVPVNIIYPRRSSINYHLRYTHSTSNLNLAPCSSKHSVATAYLHSLKLSSQEINKNCHVDIFFTAGRVPSFPPTGANTPLSHLPPRSVLVTRHMHMFAKPEPSSKYAN